jgi:hypothetical protein
MPSRRILFHTLTIGTNKRWRSLISFLLAFPDIAPMIRELRLGCVIDETDAHQHARRCFSHVAAVTYFGYTANVELLNCMPNIRLLEVTAGGSYGYFAFACTGTPSLPLCSDWLGCNGESTANLLNWLSRSSSALEGHLNYLSVCINGSTEENFWPQIQGLSQCL